MDIESALNKVQQNRQREEVGNSLFEAVGTDPDQYANDLNLSKKTGLTPDEVAVDRAGAEEEAKKLSPFEISRIISETPEAADFWKNHAKLVSDDFSTVARLKKNIRDIPESFQDSRELQRIIELNDLEMSGQLDAAGIAELTALNQSMNTRPQRGTGGFISEGLQGAFENSVQMARTIGAGVVGSAVGGGVAFAAGQAGPQVALPEELITVPTGVFIGGNIGRSYENYQQQSRLINNDIMQIRDENGLAIDRDVRIGASVLAGVANAGLDTIGLNKVLDNFPGFDKIKGHLGRSGIKKAMRQPALREAFGRIGKRFATGVAAEGTTEAVQEMNQIIAEELSKEMTEGEFKGQTLDQALDRMASAFEGGAAVGTVLGGVGATASAVKEVRTPRATPEQVVNHVSNINQAVRSEKLFQRSPEAFKNLMDNLAGDEKFYVSAQAALDGINSMEPAQRDALFNAVPELRTELETASQTDSDIAIRKADYASFIAPYQQADALVEHIKLDPADMSVAERRAVQEALTSNPELATVYQAPEQQLNQDTVASLEKQVRKALKASGRSSQEAKALSSLYARKIARDASAFGFDPLEEANKMFLGFETVDDAGNPIQQSSNIDTLLFDIQKVDEVDAKGKYKMDEPTRAAIKNFQKKMQDAGISAEQAQQMGGRAVFDQLYPEPTRMDAGDTEVVLPQVEVTADENGQLNLSITPPDIEGREAIEKLFQTPSPAGFPDKNSLGFYSQLEKEVMGMNLPNWKPNPKKAMTDEEKAALKELRSMGNWNTPEAEKLILREREAKGLASGAEVWGKIRTLPVKQEELEWSGIEEFLKAGDKFTRDEVLDYIRGNGINIEQVTADKDESENTQSFDWEQETIDDPDYVNSRAEDLLSEYREDPEKTFEAISGIMGGAEALYAKDYTDQGGELGFDYKSDEYKFGRLRQALLDDDGFVEWMKDEYGESIDNRIEEYAQETAQEEYDSNPYYRWYDSTTGYEITGNDDIGYSIMRPNGKRVSSGEIYSFNEAELQAEEDAREYGYFESPEDENTAKWSQYTMRGPHSNYRELKLTLPDIEGDFYNETHFPDRNIVAFLRVDDREFQVGDVDAALAALPEEAPDDYSFFPDDAAASVTMGRIKENLAVQPTEGEDADVTARRAELQAQFAKWLEEGKNKWSEVGRKNLAKLSVLKKAYFIDEFQSDWHQDGRQEGYKTGKVDAGELDSRRLELENQASDKFKAIDNEDVMTLWRRYAPNLAPGQSEERYSGNLILGVRALLKARDDRKTETDPEFLALYDRVEAMPEIQEILGLVSEAADLKAQVNAERHGVVDAPFKGDNWIALGIKRALIDAAEGGYEAVAWPDAEVLMDRWSERYEKLYRTQYDQKMPSLFKKLTKQEPKHVVEDGMGYWIIPLTPELRGKIMSEGFSLFQKERGSITFIKNAMGDMLKRVVVSFTKNANLSTGAHEFAHFGVAMHRKYAKLAQDMIANGQGNADMQRIVDDWQKLKKAVGATSDKFTVEQEEKIARMFEGYLRNGEAPSDGLRGVFSRFREWLVAIYNDVRVAGIEVNPEVAEVFDRWLASEQEIEAVKQKYSPLKDLAASLNLEGEVAQRLQAYIDDVKSFAEEKLYREMTREQRKQETKAYKEEFSRERSKVEQELRLKREYNLLDYLRKNNFKLLSGPETNGLPEDVVGDGAGENIIHPDIVADLFGYETGKKMLTALRNTPEFEGAVNRETRARLKEKYPNMIEDGRIHSEAISAVMNDKTLLALDLLVKEIGKGKGQTKGIKLYAKAVAQQQVMKMLAKDSGQMFRYDVARDKAMREAIKVSRKGKPEEAIRHLYNAMVNQMIYKNLEAFSEVKEKAEALYAKVDAGDKELAKRADMDFIGAARYILYKYGLGGQDFDASAWMQDLKESDPLIQQDLAAAIDAIEAPRKQAKELTVSEYTQIYNAIQNIYHAARGLKEFERQEKKVNTEKVVGELVETMSKHDQVALQSNTQLTGLNKFRRELNSIKGALRRVELWAEAIDGGKDGVFKEYLWKPVERAENEYISARRKWLRGYLDILKKHKKNLRDGTKIETGMIRTDTLGRSTPLVWHGKNEMIGFLLHTGNNSNLEKLLGGYGIPMEAYRQSIADLEGRGIITAEDWKLVQELWDYVETMKPLAQQAHKKLYGYRFEEIEPSPVNTRYGSLRGGYWPAIADPDATTDSKEIDEIISDTNRYMLATVNKGMLKSRVEKYKAPLKTDLRLGSQHVDKMLRFIYLEPAARQVAHIVNHRDFRENLAAVDPEAYSSMLLPWLQRFTAQSTEPNNAAGDRSAQRGRKMLNYTRSAAMRQLMLYNPVVAMQNIANMSVVGHLVGHRNLARAFAKVSLNPSLIRHVESASKMMEERNTIESLKISQELNQIAERKRFNQPKDFMVRNGTIFMRGMDMYLSTVSWVAAYDKAIKEGASDLDAIAQADSVVRKAQGARGSKDVAKIEASHPAVQFLMPFYGYFNSQLNLQQTEFGNIMRQHGWRGAPKMFMAYISLLLAPALLGQLIVDALRDRLPDDDDEDGEVLDDWLAWATMTQLKYINAELPIVGQGLNAAVNAMNNNPMDDRLTISPAVSLLETGVRTAKNVARAANGEDVDDSRMVQDMLMTLGFATGLPLGQFGKPLGYLSNVEEGDQPKADNILEFGQGLVAGPKPERK